MKREKVLFPHFFFFFFQINGLNNKKKIFEISKNREKESIESQNTFANLTFTLFLSSDKLALPVPFESITSAKANQYEEEIEKFQSEILTENWVNLAKEIWVGLRWPEVLNKTAQFRGDRLPPRELIAMEVILFILFYYIYFFVLF